MKTFPRNGPFVREINLSPVISPNKGQWCGFDVFFDPRLNNGWVNNREAGDLRRHRDHYHDYDVTVMTDDDFVKVMNNVIMQISWYITAFAISSKKARLGTLDNSTLRNYIYCDIPPQILKVAAHELDFPITNLINLSVKASCFPSNLKKKIRIVP